MYCGTFIIESEIEKKVKNISSQMEDVSSQLDTKVKKSEFLKLVDNVDIIKNYSASKEYVNTKIESLGNSKTFKGSCKHNFYSIYSWRRNKNS